MGTQIVVRAARDIREGERICISYVADVQLVEACARERDLLVRFGPGGCFCERCTNPTRLAHELEIMMGEGLELPLNDTLQMGVEELHRVGSSATTNLGRLGNFARKVEFYFGPQHSVLFNAYKTVLTMFYAANRSDEAAPYAPKLRAAVQGLLKRGVVSNALMLLCWCDFMEFAVTPVLTPIRTDEELQQEAVRAASKKRKKARSPSGGGPTAHHARIADAMRAARHSIETYLDYAAFDFDCVMSSGIGLRVELMRQRRAYEEREKPGRASSEA